METDEKVFENRLRRMAKRLGLALAKSRAKRWSVDDQQQYRILEPNGNRIIQGESFDLSLDAVEAFLAKREREMMESSRRQPRHEASGR